MILKQLLKLLNDLKLEVKVSPSGVIGIQECIIYDFTTRTNDGIKRQDSLKLRVNTLTYGKNIEITEAITKALCTVADKRLNDTILEVVQNGGGYLYNEETKLHTTILTFNIKSKVR